MKKTIILFSVSLLLFNIIKAQYFQGSFKKDASNSVNLKIAFTIKPSAGITTQISYMEAAFRFPTAATPAFTIDNIFSNTATFPGLAFQRFTPDYAANGYTYVKFVFNTAIVPSAAYTSATDYTLFTITTSLPATATPQFEMVSNLAAGQYQFGAADGAGNFINPNTGDQLYGPGFSVSGNDHILPLFAGALPVTFAGFSVIKEDKDARLTWTVENQSVNTSHFEVERSVNGIDFTSIKNVMADITVTTASYTFTDAEITSLNAQVIYYRVKQADKDGRYVYTEIRSIKMNAESNGSSLYPNPAVNNSVLSFHLPAADKVNIILIDAGGKSVQHIQLTGAGGLNQKSIDVSKLATGTYKVIVQSGAITETLKLVKAM